jgi:hypothetical protein
MGEPIQEISASDGSELDGAQIFEMNRELPFPAMCLSRGEARAVMPSLDKELVGTIRKIARRERGDRADDLSELCLRILRLVERLF